MMIGSLLTALVVAREWERGTIEALLATPASVTEFLIGKVVPNFFLGLTAMAISVLFAVCSCSTCPCAARSSACLR